jgi:hypothetical protein
MARRRARRGADAARLRDQQEGDELVQVEALEVGRVQLHRTISVERFTLLVNATARQ